MEYLEDSSNMMIDFLAKYNLPQKENQQSWQKILSKIIILPLRLVASALSLISFAFFVIILFAFACLFFAWLDIILSMSLLQIFLDLFLSLFNFKIGLISFLGIICFTFLLCETKKTYIKILTICWCNILVYWIPLGYAAYKWRYAYLVDKLAIAEIDKINDYNCQTLIDAFQKRTATFKVSVNSYWAYNDHVGHEWSIYHSFNKADVKQNPFYIDLSEGDTLDIYTVAIEHDNFPDVGRCSRSFLIPWWYLAQRKVILDQQVYVVENRGRFSGGVSQVNTTYTIQRVGDIKPQPLEEAKKSIPKDSVLKYFFTFRKFYDKKYDIEEKPWVKYMTSKEIDCTKSIYEYTNTLRKLYDNPDYNPTEEYVIER